MVVSVFIQVLFSPKTGWKILKEVSVPSKQILFQLLSPIILFSSLLIFVGTFTSTESNINLAFKYFGFSFLKWITTIILSTWAINKLVGGFKGKKNFSNSFFIVVLSTLLPILFVSLSYVLPLLGNPLLFFSLIGFLYYLLGFRILSEIPNERFVGFLLILSLVFVVNLLIMQLFWSVVFSIPFSL